MHGTNMKILGLQHLRQKNLLKMAETMSLCFILGHEEKGVAGDKNTYSAAPCMKEVK